MARIRNVKPEFFEDEKLCELEPIARLLFQALWCLADSEGRLEDRVKWIKLKALPYDNCDIDDLLNQLQERGFITRYIAGQKPLIQVTNFVKHQRLSGKEASLKSIYPGPTGTIQVEPVTTWEAPGKHPGSDGERQESQEGKGKEEEIEKQRAGAIYEIIEGLAPLYQSAEIWKAADDYQKLWGLRESFGKVLPLPVGPNIEHWSRFPPSVVQEAIETAVRGSHRGIFPESIRQNKPKTERPKTVQGMAAKAIQEMQDARQHP